MSKPLILDPRGYFLIRTNPEKNLIEVGFCEYKDMVLGKSNKVLQEFSSDNVDKILEWIDENKLCTQMSHFKYLRKELKKAKKCLVNKKDYVQG